jgi:hypothetical protein
MIDRVWSERRKDFWAVINVRKDSVVDARDSQRIGLSFWLKRRIGYVCVVLSCRGRYCANKLRPA